MCIISLFLLFFVCFFFSVLRLTSLANVSKKQKSNNRAREKKKTNSNKQTQKQITQMLFYNFSNILHVHYSSAYYLSFIIFGFSIIENKTKKKKKKMLLLLYVLLASETHFSLSLFLFFFSSLYHFPPPFTIFKYSLR